jgi:hypothetical protein
MRVVFAALSMCVLAEPAALAQCAPAPDSAYFFRGLSEQRAEASLTADRAVYEKLLADRFTGQTPDGASQSREDFIATEIAAQQPSGTRRFYAIRDYTLLEHRVGYTVATYVLIEGVTGSQDSRLSEARLREVYEVVDGRWRLTSVERQPVQPAAAD